MSNPKLIWKLLNSLYTVPILIYLFTIMHWPLFYRFTVVHDIIMVAVIYGVKSWVEVKFNISNLIKKNLTTKILYFISGGIALVGFLFKILHWPFSNSLLIIGFMGVLLSFGIIFFIDDSEEKGQSNPEILDDI